MFWKATLQQFGVPPMAASHIWFIAWHRQFHGIPYRFEGLNISLDAETGAVEGLCLSFPSFPVTRASMNISHDQAAAIAQASVARSGDHNAILELVRTEIVPSRAVRQHAGGIVPASTMRPVWVCVYAVEGGKREIKIDTETGEIVGDVSYGPRGGRFHTVSKAKSPAATADPNATAPASTTHS